jgi:hypothetical protein
MPPLSSSTFAIHTSQRTNQKLQKSMSLPTLTDDRKRSTTAQHCIKAIAGEVVNSRSVHLINFGSGGQIIALKSATALILDRWKQFYQTEC